MSLKALHIVFITASTLLSAGFGAWALRNYFVFEGDRSDLVMGSVSLVVSVVLVIYGFYFLKKLKNISYL